MITAHPPHYSYILLAVLAFEYTGKTMGWGNTQWVGTGGYGYTRQRVLGSEEVIATCWSVLRCVFKFIIALSSANHYRILKCA